MKTEQSRDDFINHLREHLRFLEASSRSYDEGFEGEAKRLAVGLRVLLHDTKASHSLLQSLGAKSTLLFCDVVGPVPENASVFTGLDMGFTPHGMRYYPNLRTPRQQLPFDSWWSAIVLLNEVNEIRFTRRDAVLSLANTDGGAHVDPQLDAAYAALSRKNAFGWEVWQGSDQGIVENSPALPIARQVAHEVLGTVREQLAELL